MKEILQTNLHHLSFYKTSSDHLRGLLTSILVIRQGPSDYFVGDIVRRIHLMMKNEHLLPSLGY